MSVLYAILWLLAVFISVGAIYLTVGSWALTQMFPEGQRWWHMWARIAALMLFAAIIKANPWDGFFA